MTTEPRAIVRSAGTIIWIAAAAGGGGLIAGWALIASRESAPDWPWQAGLALLAIALVALVGVSFEFTKSGVHATVSPRVVLAIGAVAAIAGAWTAAFAASENQSRLVAIVLPAALIGTYAWSRRGA